VAFWINSGTPESREDNAGAEKLTQDLLNFMIDGCSLVSEV